MKLFDKLFAKAPKEDPRHKDIKELEALFSSIPGADARYLASFALLLARVADADDVITDGEKSRIKVLLAKYGGLNASYAEIVANTALNSALAKTVELKEICEELNSCASKEQKKNVVRSAMYVATDEGISDVEVEDMRNMAKMLKIGDADFNSMLEEFNGRQSA